MQDLKSFFLLDDICILRDGKQTTMGNLKKGGKFRSPNRQGNSQFLIKTFAYDRRKN